MVLGNQRALAGSGITAAGDGVARAGLGAQPWPTLSRSSSVSPAAPSTPQAAGSTRLGEIGLRLANDAAKPILGSFAVSWDPA